MNITEALPIIERQTAPHMARDPVSPVQKVPLENNLDKQGVEEKPELDRPMTRLEQEKLASSVNSIREYLSSMGVKLEFQIHSKSDQIQVKVIDPENDKIIRKIPADEILELAASIEEMVGLFINKSL